MRRGRLYLLGFLAVSVIIFGVFLRVVNLEEKVYTSDEVRAIYRLSGYTSEEFMADYPWISVDSTSIVMTAVNGVIMTPFGKYKMTERSGRSNLFYSKESSVLDRVQTWMEKYKLSMEGCKSGEADGHKSRILVNFHYMKEIIHSKQDRPFEYHGPEPLFEF